MAATDPILSPVESRIATIAASRAPAADLSRAKVSAKARMSALVKRYILAAVLDPFLGFLMV
jgi:hypothetical protein